MYTPDRSIIDQLSMLKPIKCACLFLMLFTSLAWADFNWQVGLGVGPAIRPAERRFGTQQLDWSLDTQGSWHRFVFLMSVGSQFNLTGSEDYNFRMGFQELSIGYGTPISNGDKPLFLWLGTGLGRLNPYGGYGFRFVWNQYSFSTQHFVVGLNLRLAHRWELGFNAKLRRLSIDFGEASYDRSHVALHVGLRFLFF